MRREIGIVVSLSAIAFLTAGEFGISGARAQSATPPPTANAGPKTAEQQYKNIQVLKGIPADQLIPAMQFIAASLGVECEFCHVRDAFEKDDKKSKQTARKMMEMMFAINADDFESHREVTCYSCHRGNIRPVAIPPVMSEAVVPPSSEPAQTAQAEGAETRIVGGPTAEDLLDKYLQAAGGAVAIDKVTTRVMKGTITFGDRKVPIEIFSKDPDKRISFTHTPDGDSVTAFDGKEGWLAAPKRAMHAMHGSDTDAAAMDADLHFPDHLKGLLSKPEVKGKETIDGHDAYFVQGDREGKPPLKLYFDEKSGLLVRLIRYGDTPLGLLPTQVDYADYREVDGVKIPFRWTLARPGGRFTIQLTDVKQNIPVDDAKFAKPPAPPTESKAPTK
jgi:photosynthetic reaction center cytochrome c subunit